MRRRQIATGGSKTFGVEATHSLAYRHNRTEIWNGNPPKKYTRLLPYIHGDRIVEIGAAEGVLALMLAAREGTLVAAVERHQHRHYEACRLKDRWRDLGLSVDRCRMVLGDIKDHIKLLDDADTMVAIRCIYYFKNEIDRFMVEVSQRVRNVVLCGNPGRARRFYAYKGKPPDKLGKYNFYSSVEGMSKLLQDHGYCIKTVVKDGDPIVVGVKE